MATRTIYLNDTLDEWLKTLAVKQERSLSWTITRLLTNVKYREEQELIQEQQGQIIHE